MAHLEIHRQLRGQYIIHNFFFANLASAQQWVSETHGSKNLKWHKIPDKRIWCARSNAYSYEIKA